MNLIRSKKPKVWNKNEDSTFWNKSETVFKGIYSRCLKKLMEPDVEVYAYDPFVSEEKAAEFGVTLISNHLANKPELKNVFNRKLFSVMKKHSTFINTGRGAQVSEYSLALSLLLHPSRTFVADVIKNEYFPYINPLLWCPNAC